ncbi:MAG: hypothetical protein JJT78_11870 [Leptospira sp.]|nr:hypothetical protein [Leptospira sp.]
MSFKSKVFFGLIVFCISTLAVSANPKEFSIQSIPGSADDYVKFRDQIANTPEGGAITFLVAMMGFSKSEELGMQYLTIALDSSNLSKGNTYKGFTPAGSIMYHVKRFNQSGAWEYTPFAYVQGTNPQNRYQTSAPYKVLVSRNKFSGEESSGQVKVFIHVFGVSPRPLTMKVNDKGIWKANELSSMFLAVQAPPKQQSDDL